MQSLGLDKIKPTQLVRVESRPLLCPYCNYMFEDGQSSHLIIESVKRIEHGLMSGGVVMCPNCGDALRTIQSEIELAASTFQCPLCHSNDTLGYQIEKVEPQAGHDLTKGFTFEVKVTCSKCSHKKSFQRIVKSILDVIKLKVGPDGVEVSKAD